MLLLTSYARMRRYLTPPDESSYRTDSYMLERDITNWIMSTSRQIERWLHRTLIIDEHTEYFNLGYAQTIFFPAAYPITTLTSVYEDPDGLWDGGESEIDDVYIGRNSDSVVIPATRPFIGPKTIRIIYTGGLAYHGTRSVFASTGSSGTWTAGQYVKGGTSGAVGIVRASTATTLTVENLSGIFEAGDALTEYTDEACTSAGDATATLGSVTTQSLAEAYPDITRAAEIQVRNLWKHKLDFELTGTNKDGTTIRRTGADIHPTDLVPEAVALLHYYRRYVI